MHQPSFGADNPIHREGVGDFLKLASWKIHLIFVPQGSTRRCGAISCPPTLSTLGTRTELKKTCCLAHWHRFGRLHASLVAFPVISWSFRCIICYCGTSLYIFGPSTDVYGVQAAQNGLKNLCFSSQVGETHRLPTFHSLCGTRTA